jgi:putative heme iron utilization protein
VAALGTLHAGSPRVSLVPYAVQQEATWALLIHISGLALHTRDIQENPRVGAMIAEPDDGSRNPQTLARLSFQGLAQRVTEQSGGYLAAREAYLRRFPKSAINFGLGDFSLYRIVPLTGRFIAGFGQIHDLEADDFAALGTGETETAGPDDL